MKCSWRVARKIGEVDDNKNTNTSGSDR